MFLVISFFFIAILLQRRYISAKREFVRLESITKSPIVSTFSDIIKGLSEIRSMKLEYYFINQLRYRQNENLKNGILVNGCNAWFNVRVTITNIFTVQLPCYAYLTYMLTQPTKIDAITMVVIYSANVTVEAINFLNMLTEVETSFVSVERCANFEKIEPEPNYTSFIKEEKKMINLPRNNSLIKASSFAPPLKVTEYQIINHGHIEFCNISARYPAKSENV